MCKQSLPESGFELGLGAFSELFPEGFCVADCKASKVKSNLCELEENFDGGKRISLVEEKKGRLRRMEFRDRNGANSLTISYQDYRRSGKVHFPYDIEVSFPSAGLNVRLIFDRVEANVSLEERALRLDPIPGTTVLPFSSCKVENLE